MKNTRRRSRGELEQAPAPPSLDGSFSLISYSRFYWLLPFISTFLADKHSRSKPLSVEEEQTMQVYCEYKLREVCNAFYFPHKIQVCGHSFGVVMRMKRMDNDDKIRGLLMMEHDLKHIMCGFYSACKIEENHVSAEKLSKGSPRIII